MKGLLKTIQASLVLRRFNQPKLDFSSNVGLIRIYNQMRTDRRPIPEDEPNYELAKKVFLDFNECNLKNLEIHMMYLKFVPQSLLPYPKNYIECAYFIFLNSLKISNDHKMIKAAKEISYFLFREYPDFEQYQENLKIKSFYDDLVFQDHSPTPRELFKKLYGVYQITKEQYEASPSAVNASREILINDFGIQI